MSGEKPMIKFTTTEYGKISLGKKWVGLTDEEKRSIFDSCEREDRGYVAAMVEAKLKDKNAA